MAARRHQHFQLPRQRAVEARLGYGVDRLLVDFRRVCQRDAELVVVIGIPEADDIQALRHLQPVKNAPAHKTRAAERITAIVEQDQQIAVRIVGHQPVVDLLPQQIDAQRRLVEDPVV